MSVFDKILVLSKRIAISLLKKERPGALDNSEIFNNTDKEYILKNLTDKSLIRERKDQGNQINIQADLKKVRRKIKVPVRQLYWKYVAAASVIALLATGYFFREALFSGLFLVDEDTTIVNSTIEKGTDKAVLTLEDGTTVTLEKGKSYQANNISSNGEKLVYSQSKNAKESIKFNYLTIPRGGQFAITLSDGTRVWLNSESQLKYPIAFIEGATREVELVYGEAYFDVSPSTDHNGAKFKVLSRYQEVEVLGTEFNVKAYKDETNTYTTLVEGKVAVSSENSKQDLTPNQQSILNMDAKTFTVETVDVYNEISWKEGVFSFEGKSLEEIMKVLSRWYDMEVVLENEAVKNVEFNGSLGKDQSIEEILNIIKNFKVIRAYEINNRTVILK